MLLDCILAGVALWTSAVWGWMAFSYLRMLHDDGQDDIHHASSTKQ